MAWRAQAKPAEPTPKPLFKPINELTMKEYMDAENVTYTGRRETL
jgi:hypothetical protein